MKKLSFIFLFIVGSFLIVSQTKASIEDITSERCGNNACSKVCRCTGMTANGNRFVRDFYNKQSTVISSCTQVGYGRQYEVYNRVFVDLDNNGCLITHSCNSQDIGVSCTILPIVETKYCCCKNIVSGSLTTNRECRVIKGDNMPQGDASANLACSEDIYTGGFSSSVSQQSADYPSFPIDAAGDCSTYIKSTTNYKGTASTTNVATLQREAADSLNPMGFGIGTAGVNEFIGRIINGLTFIMGSLLLLFYVYAGILWMTAAGNTERTGKAKKIVVWSTMGVVVMLASYMIIKIVFGFIG